MMRRQDDKKKVKLPLKRMISNNLFMLGLIHKASRGLVLKGIVTDIFDICQQFVFGTWILSYILNSINKGKDFYEMAQVVMAWTVFGVFAIVICAVYDERVYRVRILDVKRYIHRKVYEKASEVELKCYENPEYYDRFVKAIDECGIRADELILAIRKIITRVLSLLLNGTLIVMINPFLLLFAFIPLLVSAAQVKVNKVTYQKRMETLEEERHKEYARRVFYLADYAKEMRLTNMPELMLVRFQESGERVLRIIKKYGYKIACLRYLVSNCKDNLAPLGATFCAVWQAFVAKTIGYGDCLVIVNSIDRVSNALTNSSNELMKFQESALYIENLRAFMEYEPQLKGGSKELPAHGDIILDNVSFRYEGAAEETLHQVSMQFGAKEKVAIVGHNGAGKTTLVKLLLRLYDAKGSITYGGGDIKEYNPAEYRSMFSAVMQDFHVFALSVAENVMQDICTECDRENIQNTIEKSGLSAKVASFSKGIDTLMTKEFDNSGVQLSGGQQQKLAIAHVYSGKNRFVILDEPSSALDPIAEYEMYNRMVDACKDCGMIFISHRLSSAVLADRIYLMEQGEVAECGSHDELMKKNGKYAEMFRKQAQNYVEDKVPAQIAQVIKNEQILKGDGY